MSISGDVQLGLGLTSIGRIWGHVPAPPPSEGEARALLEAAFRLGIRVFDTAPAYGTSEARLGRFLGTLTRGERERLFVATKFGEHWNGDGSTHVDHSHDALMRSLERSVACLCRVDLLQVHKASVEVLRSDALNRALEEAQGMGIRAIGASVSDMAAARLALDMRFHWLQLPFNPQRPDFLPIIEEARQRGIRVMANRALANGSAFAGFDDTSREVAIAGNFDFIRTHLHAGALLTGTKSIAHLEQNVRIWRAVG